MKVKLISLSLAALLAIAAQVAPLSRMLGPNLIQAVQTGDVNCDQTVNPLDAALLLQLSAGLISSLPCPGKADVNGDGSFDPLDAALVLQFSAGLLPRLEPADTPTPTTAPTATNTQPPAPTATSTPTLAPISTNTPTSTPALPSTPTHTPSPTATPTPIQLDGGGQEATGLFQLAAGLTVFHMEHAGDSNFAIWLLDDTGDRIDLLVNEIGEFAGSTVIGVDDAGSYLLDVSANGTWKVTIEQPRGITGTPPPLNITGEGQSVSQFISLQSGLTRFDMTHDGDSNFAIWLFDDDGSRVDLLVNEIGEFDGSTAIGVDQGTYILDISADGNWKVDITQ